MMVYSRLLFCAWQFPDLSFCRPIGVQLVRPVWCICCTHGAQVSAPSGQGQHALPPRGSVLHGCYSLLSSPCTCMCPLMQLWMHETYSLTCCPGGVITALTDAGARPLPLRSAPMPAHRHAVASRRASTHRTPAVLRVGADTDEAPGTDTDEARRNVTWRHGLNYCLHPRAIFERFHIE